MLGRCPRCRNETYLNEDLIFKNGRSYHISCFLQETDDRIGKLLKKADQKTITRMEAEEYDELVRMQKGIEDPRKETSTFPDSLIPSPNPFFSEEKRGKMIAAQHRHERLKQIQAAKENETKAISS